MGKFDGEGYVNANGHRLFYRRIGKPVRGTVVALHGGPGLTHDGCFNERGIYIASPVPTSLQHP